MLLLLHHVIFLWPRSVLSTFMCAAVVYVLQATVQSLNKCIQCFFFHVLCCSVKAVGHTPGSVQAQHTVSGHFTGLWEFPKSHSEIASPRIRQFP